MRYPQDHKAKVRQQLLQDGARHAKKHGFAASGVDALAGAAGLTTGSLYKHFDNKNVLFSALIQAELEQTVSRFAQIEPGDNSALLKALAGYLSMSHVRSPESGCPAPSLAADVARASDEVRMAFEAGVVDFQKTLKALIGSGSVAWTLIAQSVGAVMMARAMQDESTQRAIMTAVRSTSADLLNSLPRIEPLTQEAAPKLPETASTCPAS
jgi:AcrR family transcriptional regulator